MFTVQLLSCSVIERSVLPRDVAYVGVTPRPLRRFSKNRYYKSAMHAAVLYPDMAMIISESGNDSHNTVLPGSKQVSPDGPSLSSWKCCALDADTAVGMYA